MTERGAPNPITFTLQFRGQVARLDGGLRKEASAPGCALVTSLNAAGLEGRGQLEASPDPHLRQGTVVWKVAGGKGRFAGANGLITSNFFLSDTGELTEHQPA